MLSCRETKPSQQRDYLSQPALPIDCWNIIQQQCDFPSQIALVSTTKEFHTDLKILDLYHIDDRYLSKLTDEILKYPIFDQVELLDADNNSNITDISFMASLKVLNARHHCGINQNGIKGLNLVTLNASNNSHIVDVSFMTRLKILDASHC